MRPLVEHAGSGGSILTVCKLPGSLARFDVLFMKGGRSYERRLERSEISQLGRPRLSLDEDDFVAMVAAPPHATEEERECARILWLVPVLGRPVVVMLVLFLRVPGVRELAAAVGRIYWSFPDAPHPTQELLGLGLTYSSAPPLALWRLAAPVGRSPPPTARQMEVMLGQGLDPAMKMGDSTLLGLWAWKAMMEMADEDGDTRKIVGLLLDAGAQFRGDETIAGETLCEKFAVLDGVLADLGQGAADRLIRLNKLWRQLTAHVGISPEIPIPCEPAPPG
jgi:hypothetical protein